MDGIIVGGRKTFVVKGTPDLILCETHLEEQRISPDNVIGRTGRVCQVCRVLMSLAVHEDQEKNSSAIAQ